MTSLSARIRKLQKNIRIQEPMLPAKIVFCKTPTEVDAAKKAFAKEAPGKYSIQLCYILKDCRRKKEK